MLAMNRLVTVLPCINTELVDTGWGLGQNIYGLACRIHVVEEVYWQGREGKHQQPQNSKYIRHHYKLCMEKQNLGKKKKLNRDAC